MTFRISIVAALVLAGVSMPVLAQDEGILVYNAQHEGLTQGWADAIHQNRPASR
jgi:hypothetical protein